MFYTIPRE
jgi:hypothetical protein